MCLLMCACSKYYHIISHSKNAKNFHRNCKYMKPHKDPNTYPYLTAAFNS